MTQALAPLGSLGPLLIALILVSLGVGLPIIVVLAIRFLWYRDMNIGRSRELDKLVWQLHRIASALEQEKALSFSAEQPATERSAASVAAQRPIAAQPANETPAPPTQGAPTPRTPTPGTNQPPKAGVNSMFGF